MGFIIPPAQAREDNPVDYLVHKLGIALPYYPQLGLEPNIYYVPPIHADRGYLHQMFGPQVNGAIERYQRLKDDPKAQGLFVLFGSTDKILDRFQVEGGQAVGFDASGKELVRVPVVEPVIERQPWDEKLGTTRTNTP
jgi:nitrate reductase beta subunit